MPAQIHLAFNHFPFVLTAVGAVFLLASWIPRLSGLRRSALLLLVLSGVLAVPTYFSGEGAEDVLRSHPDFPGTLIHNHEELAKFGFVLTLILAIAATALLWVERTREVARIWYALLVVGALVVLVMLGRISHLGGLISHPELRSIPTN